MRREWSDDELEKLKKLWSYTSRDIILKEINRSWRAIQHKASRLGLKRFVFSDGRRRWTDEEIKKFIDLYPKLPRDQLEKIFGRRMNSLRAEASRLGIGRNLLVNIKVPVIKISLRDKGYIAGIVDGEGSIGIYEQGLKRGGGARRMDFYPRVTVTNTYKGLIDYINDKLGMGIVKKRERGKHQTIWIWQTCGIGETIAILNLIKNYLIVKRRQAELVLEFCRSRIRRAKKYKSKSYLPYSKREKEIIVEIWKLNKSRTGKKRGIYKILNISNT